MKLSEAMRERMLLSFELFPPKTEKGMDNLPGTIDHLAYFSVSTNVSAACTVCTGNVRRFVFHQMIDRPRKVIHPLFCLRRK